jgi:hypothetical protein
MRVAVGIDVAKAAHWVTVIDDAGTVLIDRSVATKTTMSPETGIHPGNVC